MLNSVKQSLRIKNTSFDTEISDLIDAAKTDLNISGVNTDKKINVDDVEVIDPLIKRAITLYVKANFGWDNPDSIRLQNSYESLRTHLALSGDYNVVE